MTLLALPYVAGWTWPNGEQEHQQEALSLGWSFLVIKQKPDRGKKNIQECHCSVAAKLSFFD